MHLLYLKMRGEVELWFSLGMRNGEEAGLGLAAEASLEPTVARAVVERRTDLAAKEAMADGVVFGVLGFDGDLGEGFGTLEWRSHVCVCMSTPMDEGRGI